ncbi:uncharacterized protein B0H18DRAFT_401555 [Fomitopsis serialis]|uniref:uncharacterized protein n=1 Tax=Fomitopsis serialis TaxID=139415 RepID=UPI002007F298|nr:uncharacterized protein B0H18DRAFT_401555 [Neoantrodia serialis]KAH9924773.1 hypothetical protein B0H18DRAFT_401555 [Neoantrodia serialis]
MSVARIRSILPVGGFATLVPKGTSEQETKEFSFAVASYYAQPQDMSLSASLMAYRGRVAVSHWMDVELAYSFFTLCRVTAEPPQSAWNKHDGPKKSYREQHYDVIMRVNGDEGADRLVGK